MPDVASPHSLQSWARDLAEKIRAHDAANIDEAVELRSSDLTTLVRKSLAAIPSAMKNIYLDELDSHFPVAAGTKPEPAVPSREMEAESAAAAIRRRIPELSTRDRDDVLRQLLNDAFRQSHSGSRLGHLVLESLRKSTAPHPLDPERSLRVMEVFCEAILGLQRLVIELWREVGDRKLMGAPTLASEADFRALITRCISGDVEVPATMIEQEIDRQRRAVAAAMAMLGPFADTYAQSVLKIVGPEAIATRTPAESIPMFGNREAGYWKQYCRTWESLGHDQFEPVFLECLAKHLRFLNRNNA